MVKESRESSKKRKSSNTEPEGELYANMVGYEERVAAEDPVVMSDETYMCTAKQLREKLHEILELSKDIKNNRNTIIKKRRTLCVLVVGLKKINRISKFKLFLSRGYSGQEKNIYDGISLKHLNLMYESCHLCSEIDKCHQYKSKDEDLEIFTQKEFFQVAPASITSAFKNKKLDFNMKHKLHLQMLEFELNQRIQKAKLTEAAESKIGEVTKGIMEKKQKLAKLEPQLRIVIEATIPLQEELGIPIEKVRNENRRANLLSNELYLLYRYGSAFKEVNSDIEVVIEIIGDQDEAAQYNEVPKSLEVVSEGDNDQVEEPVEGKKRRHRKIAAVDKTEEKRKKLLEPHPLHIALCFFIKDGPVLKIKFHYRTQLKIITVTSSIELPSSITGNLSREILTGESILNELFEGDFGIETPRAGNKYLFKKLNLGSYQSLIPKLGYVYLWAQRLGGVDYLETNKKEKWLVAEDSVEYTLLALKKRFVSRFALATQLQQLEQNIIPTIPDNIEYPKLSASELTKFSSMTYTKFCESTSGVLNLVDSEIPSQHDLFYNVNITRQKVVLSASVVIKNDYPTKSPIFILHMENGKLNAMNSEELRDMERAVNAELQENVNNSHLLLSIQIKFLCSYLDVYTETMDNSNVSRSRVFFKKLGGRNRLKPFRFQDVGNGDLSVFTQY